MAVNLIAPVSLTNVPGIRLAAGAAGIARGERNDVALIEAAAGKAGARARVEALLGRAEMRRQLEALGVDPDEAASRAESLSDQEIALIAGQLEELPVGAATVPVEIILAVLAVLLLIVILI